MPNVLTKLRIDEVSAVDRGAGDGCKVVLWKRDPTRKSRAFGYGLDERQSEPSFYGRLFAGVGKRTLYRDGTGGRLHELEDLTRAEAIHWLMHDRHGRAFARERGEKLGDLADLLVAASRNRSATKRCEENMNHTSAMLKKLRSMGTSSPRSSPGSPGSSIPS
jgi:hypothetical protein